MIIFLTALKSCHLEKKNPSDDSFLWEGQGYEFDGLSAGECAQCPFQCFSHSFQFLIIKEYGHGQYIDIYISHTHCLTYYIYTDTYCHKGDSTPNLISRYI